MPKDYNHCVAIIAAAYVSHNYVPTDQMPNLIRTLKNTVHALVQKPTIPFKPEPIIVKPSTVEIRNSIKQDYIISFIDGRYYKTIKRHLTAHGLTPDSYRARYGLPDDYPMTAPSYSVYRANLAKQIGLGVPGAIAERLSSNSTAA